jgi:hypothetical protein
LIVVEITRGKVMHEFSYFIDEEKIDDYCFPKFHSADRWELKFVKKERKGGLKQLD